mmetsp:Transcript_77037/g.222803  ORF Transcript_77037/g.222803 Transcript_77037/m.222803 type:complete len:229 (-) Transcript_77037:479-1165(-)
MARMLFVCSSSASVCVAMAFSMRSMPPESAKDVKPEYRLPTRAERPSTPASCAAASPAACSITPTAVRMAPLSTKFCGKLALGPASGPGSRDARALANDNHPALRPSAAAAVPVVMKRLAKKPARATSFATIFANKLGTICWNAGSQEQAARKNLAKGLWPSGSTGSGTGMFPSGHVSDAMMRASASPALLAVSVANLSLASGVLAATDNKVVRICGEVSFSEAVAGS